jgi:SAM-dependent methyltransferase
MKDASVPAEENAPRICDYEGSSYRLDFWGQASRDYEDLAERLAIRRMLPPRGDRLVEIGAGFGRLADLYAGYRTVILLDYARSMLLEARARLGGGYRYVCADLYRLPFATAAIDTVSMVRVLHHVENPPSALSGIARALRPGGSLLLEFANKRNAKAIARYAFNRRSPNPFDYPPIEFAPLHWDFHPLYVERALAESGLALRDRRAVSHFRLSALKRALPPRALAAIDDAVGGPFGGLALAPSMFVRAIRLAGPPPSAGLWKCPACGFEPLPEGDGGIDCTGCGRHWPAEDGVLMLRPDTGIAS